MEKARAGGPGRGEKSVRDVRLSARLGHRAKARQPVVEVEVLVVADFLELAPQVHQRMPVERKRRVMQQSADPLQDRQRLGLAARLRPDMQRKELLRPAL